MPATAAAISCRRIMLSLHMNVGSVMLEHFPAKACPGLDPGWEPVRCRKRDQCKNLERVPDSEGTGTASV
jgi:hypothetical protein